ncbi:MAG TPA: NADH-quinone oxidoreductase subunit NuoF [Candidatus Mcinerneyibacteriales bacterium]|nr:NADH-quinone oxidoreductase subunit NuoF [Candidatus Mcinerneyibacteriales bacterium]HPJ69664.1 NADH-quinone oxidoreductase subunit NuoF [Candidatus Mcinerneyibacteriales bacterium]
MAHRLNVLVCSGASCISNDSLKVKEAMLAEIDRLGLNKEIKVIETGCMGPCQLGPVILVYPDETLYKKVQVEDVREIVEQHFLKGRPVERLMYKSPLTDELVHKSSEVDYFQKQVKIVLANCGNIDPESIEEYIAVGGYEALGKAVTEMTPDTVLNEIKISGLRGRGGGGFPTHMKWMFTKNEKSDEKYVICNADEGDPGAFMDRSVIEGDPHTLIEGMAIAGYVVGASKGYVYVRAEYPLAIERLQKAISQAKEVGFLGERIFQSDFSFDLEVRVGAGAFVCGEETALIHSIEGKRGTPRPRPPYPSASGVWGKPTVLNNVETYANVRHIILNGGAWMAKIGTETSKGTKVFALSGTIKNTGLAEVPMGTTIRELIYDIGGGAPEGHEIKAVQLGGPSGGCVTPEYFDTPIDYESLTQLGAMMGSGGVIAMDETACMVNTAKFFLDFTCFESCGKCTPCRVGLKQMYGLLDKITKGEGEEGDIEALEKLANTIKTTALCGLGQTAPNPVLSTIKYFRHEYEEHIHDKKCRALVCKDLISYEIDAEKCKACTLCAQKCPVDAIRGQRGVVHVIEQEKCVSCGSCYDVCPFGAVQRLSGEN